MCPIILSVVLEKSVADNILESVYNPLGREFGWMTKSVTVNRYQLLKPTASSQRYVRHQYIIGSNNDE